MNKDISSVVLAASIASIAASIYLFVRGNKESGIFVGLWAPTFIGLGSLASANHAAQEAEKTTPSLA